jgi:hypothetical protein
MQKSFWKGRINFSCLIGIFKKLKFYTMKHILIVLNFCILFFQAEGRENKNQPSQRYSQIVNCAPASSFTDLDINNVRATILNGGDMWWDLVGDPLYEIPIGSGKHSLFAGSLWIGGVDAAGSLHLAAQTYRQSGNDFWPGPLDTSTAGISPATCTLFDKHWKINYSEIVTFTGGGAASTAIQTWPGNGDLSSGQSHFLAPYIDVNADGNYNYLDGDYPDIPGDQCIWWVINDMGNIHSESGSQFQLGVEIRCEAFAYSSSDSMLNNTTFYNYEVINRAPILYDTTYFGMWIDADLGNYLDDFVGCDVSRNMGFAYNGDNNDDGAMGYGTNVPAIGVKLLNAPMNKFLYYNNDMSSIGNPVSAIEYYHYMNGIWKDSSPLVFGEDGHQTPGGAPCDFMFPGNSDPYGSGLGGSQSNPVSVPFTWTENNTDGNGLSNAPGDRRFLMSSGWFLMQPGQVINISTAVIWTRGQSPGSTITQLEIIADSIQAFFDNIFATSVSEMDYFSFQVFPNPANDHIRLTSKAGGKIDIYNYLGELIYSKDNDGNDPLTISTSLWASGNYIVTINNKGKRNSRKIAVVH